MSRKASEINAQRFWAKVDKSGGEAACWTWTGFRRNDGYGSFRVGIAPVRAHRVALVLSGIPVPAGKPVLHSCDNPPCVNPAHLRVGTHADNAKDRDERGRMRPPIGEKHGNARLTDCMVTEIRARVASGESQLSVAKAFSVSRRNINHIARWKAWRHVQSSEIGATT